MDHEVGEAMINILFLAHVDEFGNALPKIAMESLSAALKLVGSADAQLTIGLIGADVRTAAGQVAGARAVRILAVTGVEFAQARYATDALAEETIIRAASPDVVIAPGTLRFTRSLPGVSHRVSGRVDTHINNVEFREGALTATRWFYRQRIEAVITRQAKPWILLVDSGCYEAFSAPISTPDIEQLAVMVPESLQRTTVMGVRAPKSDAQTIRPDSPLLFVAGAGWTKKQQDGQVHGGEAEKLILGFLAGSQASLGGSKSLVDQSGDAQPVLGFMTHLNQVGQTGSTPRHPKGLSTCCHGEEPHVVGWRFINERRAINLDPNCGWARGKADVLYVANAFEVLAKVNAILADHTRSEASVTLAATTA
jgi:electron transfer flavoprotein alpha subunit